MKRISFILGLLLFSIVLIGCQDETNSTTQNMPENMPSDFNFSIQFGVQKKNEINTFKGIVTKDLVVDGTTTTELIITEEEMKDIYKKMKEMNITETKDFTPKSLFGKRCTLEPYGEDEWEILINGETITHYI